MPSLPGSDRTRPQDGATTPTPSSSPFVVAGCRGDQAPAAAHLTWRAHVPWATPPTEPPKLTSRRPPRPPPGLVISGRTPRGPHGATHRHPPHHHARSNTTNQAGALRGQCDQSITHPSTRPAHQPALTGTGSTSTTEPSLHASPHYPTQGTPSHTRLPPLLYGTAPPHPQPPTSKPRQVHQGRNERSEISRPGARGAASEPPPNRPTQPAPQPL